MKSLICNVCFSGFIYQSKGVQFNNPFIWNHITASDMTKLIEHFDDINFKNIDLMVNKDLYEKKMVADPHNPSIIIKDYNIRVQFNHYVYSPHDYTPRIKGADVYYRYNYRYCVEKYLARLSRMKKDDDYVFIYVDNSRKWDTYDEIKELMNTSTNNKRKMYVFTPDESLKQCENEYVKVFIERSIYWGNDWGNLTKKYKNMFF